ncbi:sulfotransferase [Oleiphilus messinensis]|uniref:Sulfotransferase n=1 Tax=Oleiphilus messinensis TaxID=141451 RepID=A0A1Y0IEA0_9GAMM|nr:sulfotransferase domain-containing protein [Oleiphilus messinensis]ARU57704.1 sulfotransferase [Oleiphilus messinensis]
MASIVWIASYPRSGNTWVRAFLTALLNTGGETPDLEHLVGGVIASSRSFIEAYLGYESQYIPYYDLHRLRKLVYKAHNKSLSHRQFIKIHDALVDKVTGEHLIDSQGAECGIYIVRNPYDVAVSYSEFSSISVEAAVNSLCDPDMCLANQANKGYDQVPQFLGDWSWHVRSWTESKAFPICVLQYEKLLLNPVEEFAKLVEFLGIQIGIKRIRDTVDAVAFSQLSVLEKKSGFSENYLGGNPFFGYGEMHRAASKLEPEQASMILERHRDVMAQYGYINCSGKAS